MPIAGQAGLRVRKRALQPRRWLYMRRIQTQLQKAPVSNPRQLHSLLFAFWDWILCRDVEQRTKHQICRLNYLRRCINLVGVDFKID